MSVVRARVELKDVAAYQDREVGFKKLLTAFKRACSEAKIQHTLRQHEAYESPGEKKRRKRRENENAKLKAKLKESFPERGKKDNKDKKKAK